MKPLILIGTTIVVLLVGAFAVDSYSQSQWDQYSSAHQCKQVAHTESTVGYGITTSGKMGTIIIPSSNAYLCDDGVTYTR